MNRQTIDYGIDLGTTNSAIARVEKGAVRILKSDRLQKDTTPSCVYYTKRGQLLVGDAAYSRLTTDPDNAKTEFKRTMGTEVQYHFPNVDKAFTSEHLSAEILKTLKNSVKDDDFSGVIITVPADFDQVQIDATQKAAEMAGFNYCELLQEPIAASLAYGLDADRIEGFWLVFDMGGGTFDAALMKADSGVIKVIDTAGDNHLGGKNMDLLIVDEIIMPHLQKEFRLDTVLKDERKRERLYSIWKRIAEQYKIELTNSPKVLIEPDDPSVFQDDDGEDIDTCIEIGQRQFESLIKPLVDRAITISHELLFRNNVAPQQLTTVLLIGGPTYIPYVRDRIKNEISPNINISIDPMTAVAAGAAIYASMRPLPVAAKKRDLGKVQLVLDYPSITTDREVVLRITADTAQAPGADTQAAAAIVSRADQAWSSGRVAIGPKGVDVRLHLIANQSNNFSIQLFNATGTVLPCEPSELNILHGIRIDNPTLPHDICVDAETEDFGAVTIPLLSKNQQLPAIGKKNFKVKRTLRAGNKEDVFNIIVREGERNTRPVRNVRVGNIAITGANLAHTVELGSDVDITIRMDESRRINVMAYFPDVDETINNVLQTAYRAPVIDTAEVSKEIQQEHERLLRLQKQYVDAGNENKVLFRELTQQLSGIKTLNEKRRGDLDGGFEVRNRLNEFQIGVDRCEIDAEWESVRNELQGTLRHTKQIVDIFGEKSHKQALAGIASTIEDIVKKRDLAAAQQGNAGLSDLRVAMLANRPPFWISIFRNIDEDSGKIQWLNGDLSRQLLTRGREIVIAGWDPELKTIVEQLWDIMPAAEKVRSQKVRDDLPFYKIGL